MGQVMLKNKKIRDLYIQTME